MGKETETDKKNIEAAGQNERFVMPDHEVIYLIPDSEYGAVWCDEHAPSDEHDADESIRYVRAASDAFCDEFRSIALLCAKMLERDEQPARTEIAGDLRMATGKILEKLRGA